MGNHRDAWTFGALDPSSGTASMIEIARVFGKIKREQSITIVPMEIILTFLILIFHKQIGDQDEQLCFAAGALMNTDL